MDKELDKILSYTVKSGSCLNWTRCVNTDGYPRALIDGNSNAKVHRVVYELVHGEIPEGLVIRHTCDNPLCINPEHLMSGTQEENVQDRVSRGRSKGHCSNEIVESVRTLRSEGLTYRSIADKLGISYKKVDYILNQLSKR